jgi:hypothetical protein
MLAYVVLAIVWGAILALQIFTGAPPAIAMDWIFVATAIFGPVFEIESLLLPLDVEVPVWLRAVYYIAMGIRVIALGATSPVRLVHTAVLALLVVVGLRKKNRTALIFGLMLIGYELAPTGVFGLPRYLYLGIVSFNLVPLYRNAPGIFLILSTIRQSAVDREERNRLAAELEAASTIQRLLITGATDGVEAAYLPATEVGGDFYQLPTLEDGSTLVAVGDVSGKGLKAAMVVAMLVGIIRSHRHLAAGALLGQINRTLAGSLDGGFVTCAIARLPVAGSWTIANAGHPAPYLEGREIAVEAGLPLGIIPDAVYAESELRVRSLTFVSDGVVEAVNAKGELFGFDRTAAVSTWSANDIAEVARAWGQNDDITVVTVRRANA